MSLDLNAIRNRAALARSIAHGPNALWRALASADDVPALLAEIERLAEHCGHLETSLARCTAERDEAIAGHGRTVDGTLGQGWELVAARGELAAVEQDRDRLQERLAAAETVCTIYGWTGGGEDSERGKATTQAWMDWHRTYGSPKGSPEWDARIAELAARRDAIRAKTLAAIRGEHSGEAGQ